MSDGVKEFRSHEQQVQLLADRGMDVGDCDYAVETLQRVNYYRLSGYWYPFRQLGVAKRQDNFFPDTKLSDVVALYEFDVRLRIVTFAELSRIELAIRALLGHELGRIDPCVHLKPALLGPTAQGSSYGKWLTGYETELGRSREDFVKHHQQKYGGQLPVWAAVDVLDWGSLTYLYEFAPRTVQDVVADGCGLTAPQFRSWLKALNLVRNTCAHHGRLFNRVHAVGPKLPVVGKHPDLDMATTEWNRTFGRLTLVQFLLDRLGLGKKTMVPAVLKSFPSVKAIPISHLGATPEWQTAGCPLWAV